MNKLNLASLVLLIALMVVFLPHAASAQLIKDAVVYFEQDSERVAEGGDVAFNILYYNEDYWLVGGSSTTITIYASGGNATYGSNYTATLDGVPFNPDGSATVSFTPYYVQWRTFEVIVHANDTIKTDLQQQFSLQASGYKTRVGSPGSNTLWIDRLPVVRFQAAQEGIDEGGSVNIGVVRSGATYVSSTVDFTYAKNISTGGVYTVLPLSQRLTFAPGETLKYITVNTVNDGYFENDYNVTFRLQSPVVARPGNIVENNLTVTSAGSTPLVEFGGTSESVDEGGSVNITVIREGDVSNTASKVELSMDILPGSGGYTISEINATRLNNNNYQINFQKGEKEKTITINAGPNLNYDDTRVIGFTLEAVNGGKALIGTKGSNDLTINDRTALPEIEFVLSAEKVDEGGLLDITLCRTGATNIRSSVEFSYAVEGYTDNGFSVSPTYIVLFQSGQKTANITITTHDDVIYGNDYRLNFTLKSPINATLGNPMNALDVTDTTPYPVVGFIADSASVNEGKTVSLFLTRSGAKNVESSVIFQYDNTLSRNMYVSRFQADPALDGASKCVITFAPNETSRTVNISVIEDNRTHDAQYAYFRLQPQKNASIGASSGYVNVEINDLSERVPEPYDIYFAESGFDASSGGLCEIMIERSAYDRESSIIFDRVSGSAASPDDYSTTVDLPYTVHFAVKEKFQKITVLVNSSAQGEKSVVFGLQKVSEDATPGNPQFYTLSIHGLTPTPTPTPEPTPTPTPAPDVKKLYVNANFDTEQIVSGYEGKITITVTDGAKPVSGAKVSIDRTGGQVIMLNPTTDAGGVCYATFKSDNPGQYTITITATAEGYDPGTATLAASVANAVPGALTVNAMVKQQPVVIGSEAEVTISVTDGGTPVQGASITIETTSGSVTPSSGTTDRDGNMFAMFHSGDPGSYILTVTAAASGHPTSRVSYAVQVVGADERHLYAAMSVDPKSVSPNSKADITVTVTDGVMPVSNAQVSLVATGGTITPESGVTDSDGKFVAQFSSGSEGTYTLGVTAYSEGIGQASYSTFIKVKQSMFDMQLLIYFIISVVILAIVLILLVTLVEKWREYDLRVVPKVGAIPADGMSRLPVRIEVFNGFGRPKKARSDTYVEIDSTAGRIESVTIPSGKNFADAVLTSSKEFGPVTIKAKIGDKASASVPVEFKLEGGSLAVTITPGMIIADSKSSASVNVRIRNSKGNYVVPLSDKVIELNTTIGDIVGSIVNMPARANSANATIVSNKEGGIAMVTATMGTLKGTGRVEFRSMSRQQCQNCGQPIPGSLPVCPSCGAPAVPADDKKATASMN
jgi:hypothetical protein